MHFNIAGHFANAYNAVGSLSDQVIIWIMSIRITRTSELEIQKRIKNRHYYLRQAQNSIKLKDVGQMHTFCALAEIEQKRIDEFTRLYPTYELLKCIRMANI